MGTTAHISFKLARTRLNGIVASPSPSLSHPHSFSAPAMQFLSNNQTRARLPWIGALCALFLIWSLVSLGVNLKPFRITLDDQPLDHLGQPDKNIGPIPVAKSTPPKYPAFEDQVLNANDTEYVSERPLILYAYFERSLRARICNSTSSMRCTMPRTSYSSSMATRTPINYCRKQGTLGRYIARISAMIWGLLRRF